MATIIRQKFPSSRDAMRSRDTKPRDDDGASRWSTSPPPPPRRTDLLIPPRRSFPRFWAPFDGRPAGAAIDSTISRARPSN